MFFSLEKVERKISIEKQNGVNNNREPMSNHSRYCGKGSTASTDVIIFIFHCSHMDSSFFLNINIDGFRVRA